MCILNLYRLQLYSDASKYRVKIKFGRHIILNIFGLRMVAKVDSVIASLLFKRRGPVIQTAVIQ